MNYTDNQSQLMFEFYKGIISQATKGVKREDLPYIRTYTGRKWRHISPSVDDVCIEDIATGLSNTCRFSGQVKNMYSVAQHAVLGSYQCKPEFALDFLHHDDTEAYYQDVPRPLKRLPGMEIYRLYENMGAKVIQEYFGLGPEPQEVKDIDARMLATEMRDLFKKKEHFDVRPFYNLVITPWTSTVAKNRYLERHQELTKGK